MNWVFHLSIFFNFSSLIWNFGPNSCAPIISKTFLFLFYLFPKNFLERPLLPSGTFKEGRVAKVFSLWQCGTWQVLIIYDDKFILSSNLLRPMIIDEYDVRAGYLLPPIRGNYFILYLWFGCFSAFLTRSLFAWFVLTLSYH